MKIQLVTHPIYLKKPDILEISPVFATFVSRRHIDLHWSHWNGFLDSLPAEPSFVFSSYSWDVPPNELHARLASMGHFPFEAYVSSGKADGAFYERLRAFYEGLRRRNVEREVEIRPPASLAVV